LPRHGAWRGKTALPRLSLKKNQYGWVDPEAKIERRGCFVFPRRRAWRSSLCRATSHGAAGQRCAPLRMARQVRVAAPLGELEAWPRERTGFCQT
jgi:hypothetical protein